MESEERRERILKKVRSTTNSLGKSDTQRGIVTCFEFVKKDSEKMGGEEEEDGEVESLCVNMHPRALRRKRNGADMI